jgi:hypothetical protein
MEVVEVSSPDQLAAVARARPVGRFMSAKRVRLRLSSVPHPLQEATERRLNFWLGICGCQLGALVLLGTLGWQIGAAPRTHDSVLEAVLFTGGLSLAAGLLGKSMAVLFARAMFMAEAAWFLWRIRRDARERRVLT